jgi:tetratricopeptide (TPR) repeat protein
MIMGKTRWSRVLLLALSLLLAAGAAVAQEAEGETLDVADDLIDEGKLTAAKELVDNALRRSDESARAHYLRSKIHYLEREFWQAIEHAGKAIELRPDYAAAYEVRMSAYFEKNRIGDFAADLDTLLTMRPHNIPLHAVKVDLKLSQGDTAAARQAAATMVELNADSVDARFERVKFHARIGEYEKALERIEPIIEMAEDPELVIVQRALLHESRGDTAAAAEDYEQVISLAPERAESYIARGDFRLRRGLADLALQDYNKAISVQPTNPAGHVARASYWITRGGDEEAAVRDMEKARSIAPEDPEVAFMLGNVYAMTGAKKKAREAYRQAAALGFPPAAIQQQLMRLEQGSAGPGAPPGPGGPMLPPDTPPGGGGP